jgi:E3 ubiquitin-protein ligase LRSAM1
VCQEKNLEFSVVDILEKASASDYVPTFARHRITIETLLAMNEDDLKQVSICNY